MRHSAIVWVVLGLFVASAVGDATKETEKTRIARLIEQLGDDEFVERQKASKALAALGEKALAALRKAGKDSKDPEIRKSAKRLVATIEAKVARTDVKSVPPPKGAVVLFDGKNLDGWVGRDGVSKPAWALTKGVMEARTADVRTRKTFGTAYKLHVEFRIPTNPVKTGVGRGNSGVYVHGKYEIQILDSYGIRANDPREVHSKPTESCGAIFGQAAPLVNVCKAPGYWQSYDIEFQPAQFKNGKKVEHPRLTVRHNGVLIHDKVKVLVEHTGQGLPGDTADPGPVLLQYHGSPVQFRNIWLLPLAKG